MVALAIVLSFLMPRIGVMPAAAFADFGAGFTTFLLPYHVPPVIVGRQVGRVRLAIMLRLSPPLAIFGIVLVLPLQYPRWRVIGYFG